MEILKKIDAIISENTVLKELKFSHLSYMKDYNIGIFYRETKNKFDIISYGFGYDHRDFDPITISKESLRSWTSFKTIENILSAIFASSDSDNHFNNAYEFILYRKETLTNKMGPVISADKITKELLYKNNKLYPEKVEEAVNNINISIKEHHLPFFNEFVCIKDLNDKIIEKYDWLDWSNFLFKDSYLKAIIIMKLSDNDKQYKSFTTMYKARIYNSIQEGNTALINSYERFIKVMEFLDSGKHLSST
jgi:hypothetical protein